MTDEESISKALRPVLEEPPIGAEIETSKEIQSVLNDLEFFIPSVLSEIHREWKGGGLECLCSVVARKIAERELEILGLCDLMRNHRVAPFYVRMQFSPLIDDITWFECRLEELPSDHLNKQPPETFRQLNNRLARFWDRPDDINWRYWATFGERLFT